MAIRKIASALLATGLFLVTPLAGAQNYPNRTVTLVVPYGPGSTDTFSRLLAERLSKIWGQPIVVDNKPGGSGILGMVVGRDAAPDGYSLLLGMSGPLAGNPNLMPKLPYDPIKDYTFVAGMLEIPLMFIAHPNAPYNNMRELVEHAKKSPGKIEWGSPGNGTTNHLAGELFKSRAGIDILHVPYKSSGQGVTNVAGGHINLMVAAVSGSLALIKGGKLKALAVTGAQRAPMMPDVPTVAESGFPGYEGVGFGGMLAPRNMPRAIVDKVATDLRGVLAEPEFRDRMIQLGLVPAYRDAAGFLAYVEEQTKILAKVVKEANIQLN